MNEHENEHADEDEDPSLGVLFVHGIGTQHRGDTLERFGSALLDWLRRQNRAKRESAASNGGERKVKVVDAALRSEVAGSGGPTQARVKFSGTPEAEAAGQWLLAESWWAEEFQTPKYSAVFGWGFKIIPLTLTTHFATRANHALQSWRSAEGLFANILALFRGVFLEPLTLVVATLLMPPFIVLLALLFIVGMVPIPGLRKWVLTLQSALTGTVGDSFVLLQKPIQRSAILGRVRRDYEWLVERKCKKIAIVAHSQGAAIAHEVARELESDRLKLLLTFGSGLNKLTRLEAMLDSERPVGSLTRLESMLESGRRIAPWIAFVGLLLVGVSAWYTILFADASGLVLIVALFFALVLAVAALLAWEESEATSPDRVRRARAIRGLSLFLGLVSLGALAAAYLIARDAGWLAVVPPAGLILVLFGIRSSVRLPISDSRYRIPGPVRWVDVYTRVDPVPNGPPPAGVCTKPFEIANRGFVLRDHNAYWRNPDVFVSIVASELTDVLNPDSQNIDKSRLEHTRKRRAWRVGWLRAARNLVVIVAAITLIRHWQRLPGLARSLPEWLNEGLVQALGGVLKSVPWLGDWGLIKALGSPSDRAIGVAVVILVAALTYAALALSWFFWNRQEVGRFFAERPFALFGVPFALFLLPLTATAGAGILISAEVSFHYVWVGAVTALCFLWYSATRAPWSQVWQSWSSSGSAGTAPPRQATAAGAEG